MTQSPGCDDYPLAERRPDLVRTRSGKRLEDLTLAAILSGEVDLADLAITPAALRHQGAIARAARRATLAANFERAAEMVDLPQDLILAIYDKLRPGRARDKAELLAIASDLATRGAPTLSAFIEEAASVYERRGLFSFRF